MWAKVSISRGFNLGKLRGGGGYLPKGIGSIFLLGGERGTAMKKK